MIVLQKMGLNCYIQQNIMQHVNLNNLVIGHAKNVTQDVSGLLYLHAGFTIRVYISNHDTSHFCNEKCCDMA